MLMEASHEGAGMKGVPGSLDDLEAPACHPVVLWEVGLLLGVLVLLGGEWLQSGILFVTGPLGPRKPAPPAQFSAPPR